MPSAVIQAMRYESFERQLMIVFRGVKGAYLYEGVGPSEWKAFRDAESKGTYLNSVFKPRHHPYRHLLPVLAMQGRHQGRVPEATSAEGEALVWGEVKALPENPFRLPRHAEDPQPQAAKKVRRESYQFELLPGFRRAA